MTCVVPCGSTGAGSCRDRPGTVFTRGGCGQAGGRVNRRTDRRTGGCGCPENAEQKLPSSQVPVQSLLSILMCRVCVSRAKYCSPVPRNGVGAAWHMQARALACIWCGMPGRLAAVAVQKTWQGLTRMCEDGVLSHSLETLCSQASPCPRRCARASGIFSLLSCDGGCP